jgi:hypothetical protein
MFWVNKIFLNFWDEINTFPYIFHILDRFLKQTEMASAMTQWYNDSHYSTIYNVWLFDLNFWKKTAYQLLDKL